jgi:hypothetical protein
VSLGAVARVCARLRQSAGVCKSLRQSCHGVGLREAE